MQRRVTRVLMCRRHYRECISKLFLFDMLSISASHRWIREVTGSFMLFDLGGPSSETLHSLFLATIRRCCSSLILIGNLLFYRNLMLRDGMLSPNSKLLPHSVRVPTPLDRHMSIGSTSKLLSFSRNLHPDTIDDTNSCFNHDQVGYFQGPTRHCEETGQTSRRNTATGRHWAYDGTRLERQRRRRRAISFD